MFVCALELVNMIRAMGALVIFLTGCTVRLVDDRIDRVKLEEALTQQRAAILAQVGYIASLQEQGVLPKPKKEK